LIHGQQHKLIKINIKTDARVLSATFHSRPFLRESFLMTGLEHARNVPNSRLTLFMNTKQTVRLTSEIDKN
jgi:hypothetical protein